MFTTEYIKTFARRSVRNFRWYYVDFYTSSVFLSIASLKGIRRISPNYLSNADKILTGHSNLFKLVGLRFLRKAYEKKLIDILLSHKSPIESPFFINTFTEVLSEMYRDMTRTMGISHTDKINTTINLVYEASLLYCWHFLNSAKSKNMIDVLNEELYLLKEIEAIKNRKGE